jgi:hypothetical protein
MKAEGFKAILVLLAEQMNATKPNDKMYSHFVKGEVRCFVSALFHVVHNDNGGLVEAIVFGVENGGGMEAMNQMASLAQKTFGEAVVAKLNGRQ